MKYLFISFLVMFFNSCKESKTKSFSILNDSNLHKIFVSKQSSQIQNKKDSLMYMNKKFTGTLFNLYPNGIDTFSIESYCNGLLNGVSKKWYQNHQKMEERVYTNGQKNGKQISYWENGKKRFEFVANNDQYQGQLLEWNINGTLVHLANFEKGQEEGTQKMWYDDGKIRANYVMINGKRYGLLGTKNCKNVSDSIFIVQ